MAFNEWSPKPAAPKINHHHRRLLTLMDEFQDAQRSAQPHKIVMAALEHLTNFVIAHFYVEEEMLKRLNYPRLGEHMVQHRRLILQLENLCDRFNKDESALNLAITDELRTEIEDHILLTHGRDAEPVHLPTPIIGLQQADIQRADL